jgi:hypothetical protein
MEIQKYRILAIDQWDQRQSKAKFLERIRKETFDKIFIFTQNEHEYNTIFDEFVFPFLGHYIESKGLNVDLITSLPPESDNYPKFKGLTVHYWDTYWLAKTKACLSNSMLVEERKRQSSITKIKYPFIMMNNRSHLFRAKLIDIVARENLLDVGAISWINMDAHLRRGYDFKFFDGNNRILDEKYFTSAGGQYSLPDQFFESFAQLISESTPKKIFFSEKISMALLNGKPFLAAAAPSIHKYLHTRLGIEYYDEIFDYAFDIEPNLERRWEMIVQNFVKISKYPLSQLEDLKNQIQDKVNYNQNRALEIVNDITFMPLPLQEYFIEYKNTPNPINRYHVNKQLSMVFDGLL